MTIEMFLPIFATLGGIVTGAFSVFLFVEARVDKRIIELAFAKEAGVRLESELRQAVALLQEIRDELRGR